MFQNLPIEVTLTILTHLSLRDIHAFQRVHSSWDEMVRSNEATIYLKAAICHGFARLGDTLDDAYWKAREDGTSSVASWKEVCESCLLNHARPMAYHPLIFCDLNDPHGLIG